MSIYFKKSKDSQLSFDHVSLEVPQTTLEHYWMTNSVSRASSTMAECIKASRQYTVHPHLDPLVTCEINLYNF